MKPSLFDPQPHVMHDASRAEPAEEDIPAGQNSREEVLAELALLARNNLAVMELARLRLIVSTYPAELRRVLADAFPLAELIDQHQVAAQHLGEINQVLRREVQLLRDEVAELRREVAQHRRQLEEPPDFQRQEEQGQLNVRRGYKFPSRRTF